jgi:hypothetical protein
VANLAVTPTTATPGQTLSVAGSGFDPKQKFVLATVDSAGVESGFDANGTPTNTNRPKPDGTFQVGINAPPLVGASKVRAYQGGTRVAEVPVLIQIAAPPPPPPPPVSGTALPSSIANATTTVDAQLRDWLMSLPDNATALLGSAQLKLAKQLTLEGRGPLRVEAQNSVIKCINRTTVEIVLFSYGARGIQWFGGTIEGSNPYPGRRQAESYEHNHAFGLRGVTGAEIARVKIRNVGGDFFYLAGGWRPGNVFGHGSAIKIHDNDCQGNGRMGVAMLDGLDGFEIWNNVMGGITWYSFDVENNGHIFSGVPAGVTSGKIHHNKIGPVPYGRGPTLAPLSGISSEPTGLAFTVTDASSGGVVVPVKDIEVSYNESTDAAWPDFRWGIYAPGTTNISVHDNKNQVKR